jgi:hypothetical protein
MGQRMVEGANINKSLLALGNCINALCESGGAVRHVPYRNSKLARLLKFSLSPRPKSPPPSSGCASSPSAPPSATPTPTPRAQTTWPPNSPVFTQQLARTAQQWARAALALLAWAHSFSAAIGLSSTS